VLNWMDRHLFLLRFISLSFALYLLSTGPIFAAEVYHPALDDLAAHQAQAEQVPLCRLGVNAPSGIAQFPYTPLRLGWYLTYGASSSPSQLDGVKYTPMIRVHQNADATGYVYSPSGASLNAAIAANPGASWFIGNEPDRRDWNGGAQDEILPSLYAQVYHELYHHIKDRDPDAKILAGSIVQPSILRLKYLDLVLSSYRARYGVRMPVDGWSIHNFILNEVSCAHPDPEMRDQCWGAEIPPGLDEKEGLRVDAQDNDNFEIFVKQIERFRHWMHARGYQNTPLYLSEYGVLMPAGWGFDPDFTPQRVNVFMNKTFDYLLNESDPAYGYPADGHRLVQRLSWFSMDDTSFNGRLFDADTLQPTAMGQNYAAYASKIVAEADYYPIQVFNTLPQMGDGGSYSVTLNSIIANSGNTSHSQAVRVRFYNGDPNHGGQQIGSEQVVSLTGCGDTNTAQVVWTNVPEGIYTVYVQVEAASGSLPEREEAKANNILGQQVIVTDIHLFLPTIER
jgi:hypothetical protein